MVLLRPFLRRPSASWSFRTPSFLFRRPLASAGEAVAVPRRRNLFCILLPTLKTSSGEDLLAGGDQIHCYLLRSGHLYGISIFNFLLKLYANSLRPTSALALFDEMPHRNIISWNTLIAGLAVVRDVSCLLLLREMMLETTRPDNITFLGVLRWCSLSGCPSHGEQAHCLVFKLGYSSHQFISSAITDMYAKLGLAGHARSQFDEMPIRDLVSWNVMISCYALNCLCDEAFEIFKLMRAEGENGDPYTYSSLLSACSSSGCVELGEQVHAIVAKSCNSSDRVLCGAMVDMYSKTGAMATAQRFFFSSECFFSQNVVPWNSIIVGYSRSGFGAGKPMKILRWMLRRGVNPDELTFSSILSSCGGSAAAREVLQLHAHTTKRGLEAFPSAGNAMIGAYAKCGGIHDAFQVFSLIPSPDLISWTAIISACAIHGLGEEALQILEKMMRSGVKPDEIAILEVLSACSHSGLVEDGLRCFVRMVEEHQIKPTSEHFTCLLDLLGRAGHLHDAGRLLSCVLQLSGADAGGHLGAFLSACRIHGDARLAELAAGLLLRVRSDNPVDFLDMGGVYAGAGSWLSAERARKMASICGKISYGCSRLDR